MLQHNKTMSLLLIGRLKKQVKGFDVATNISEKEKFKA